MDCRPGNGWERYGRYLHIGHLPLNILILNNTLKNRTKMIAISMFRCACDSTISSLTLYKSSFFSTLP